MIILLFSMRLSLQRHNDVFSKTKAITISSVFFKFSYPAPGIQHGPVFYHFPEIRVFDQDVIRVIG